MIFGIWMKLQFFFLNRSHFLIALILQAIFFNPTVATVDGDWFEWSPFSDCSATCGGGIMTRNRTCDNPEFGGNDCVGESTDTQNCGEDPCPSTYPTSEYFKQL